MRGGCDWLHICLPNRRLAGSSPVPRSRSLRYSIMVSTEDFGSSSRSSSLRTSTKKPSRKVLNLKISYYL